MAGPNLWIYTAETNTMIGTLNAIKDMRIVTRYNEPGEIEISIPVNPDMLIQPGMVIWVRGMAEAYVVETSILKETDNGEFLQVRGRTCSAYLSRRALYHKMHYSGTGASIIKQMLDSVWMNPPRRFGKFSYSINTSIGSQIDYEYETTALTLLDAIIAVCKATGLGFRCVFDPYTQNLLFELYQGTDRTQRAPGRPIIVFDAQLGNIQKMSYTESISDMATMAYVLGETDSETGVRTVLEYDPKTLTGYKRFEVALESGKTRTTDNKDEETGEYIKLTNAQYNKLLSDYGAEKLADRDVIRTTEGDILTTSQLFVFGTDYFVGDIVGVRNKRWGIEDSSRITERTESYNQGFLMVSLLVGSKLPTLMEKMTRRGV